MSFNEINRRSLLKTAAHGGVAFATVSITAKALGLPASAQTGTKIIIGSVPITASLLAYLGPIDPFKDEGITLEPVKSQTGPGIIQGMMAGSIVVGDLGLVPAMVALARGLPFVAPYFSAFQTPTRPFERIMVKQDSPIRQLSDLKGKKLAILARGSVPELALSALPKKAGIRKEDIEIVILPAANQPAALAQGQVDAIFAIPPADAVAEVQFHARAIATTTDLIPYFGFAGFMIRRDFTEAHPDAVKRMVRALLKIARWVSDNEQLAAATAAKNINLPEAVRSAVRAPLFARNGVQISPNLWQIYEMLVQAKTIDPHPDPAKLINNGFIEPSLRLVLPVAEELGWQKDAAVEAMLKGEYPLLPKPAESYYSARERQLLKL
jgi:sulfonate transport system substrate-binding protein